MSRLIPELDVADLDRSLAFYVGVVGFTVLFDRPEERFAFLDLFDAARGGDRVSIGSEIAADGAAAHDFSAPSRLRATAARRPFS